VETYPTKTSVFAADRRFIAFPESLAEWAPKLSQRHLHIHIGPGVWGGHDTVRRQGLKSDRLIQADGRREDVIRFQVEAMCTGRAGHLNRRVQQFASDAAPLARRSYGHLCNLELIGAGTKQGTAGDTLVLDIREEDPASGSQNGRLRVGQSLFVFRFEAEIARNPFFVEFSKCGLIAGLELTDCDPASGCGALTRLKHFSIPFGWMRLRPSTTNHKTQGEICPISE
jgi:hypothetical protein